MFQQAKLCKMSEPSGMAAKTQHPVKRMEYMLHTFSNCRFLLCA